MNRGIVYLVGAGPGDPGLITVRGIELLKQADLVLYDSLVNQKLLTYLSSEAASIYVGKRGGQHAMEQEEINALIVEEATKGKQVVRLKGGDPFLFGRGGEEAEVLKAKGIRFEVVPGVTSAIAAPAYAGIPVTHRNFTSAVAFVTGHEQEEGGAIPWNALSQIGTVVFLMGVGNLSLITEKLIGSGTDPETPVAVIEWGTLPRQRVVTGRLTNIVEEVRRQGVNPPAITIVGKVVSLRDKLAWFEKKPLFGKRILVTRTREQSSELSRRLDSLGAEVIEIPTIERMPPTSWRQLDHALQRIHRYDWILFTSVNGVAAFFERLWKNGRDVRHLSGIRFAAIGPATARAIEKYQIRVDLIAKEFRAEGVTQAFAKKRIRGKSILIPRAREAREVLVDGLKRLKARVEVVEAYRMRIPKQEITRLKELVCEGLDLITFASSSTVDNFMKMIGPELKEEIKKIPIASIGPITTEMVRRYGLNLQIQPKQYTIPTLVEAIVRYFLEYPKI